MTPAIDSLLERLKAQGGELVPTGPDSLKVTAPAPLPPEFMAELRQHKAELLSLMGMRRPYRFALRNGEGGGVYLSAAPNVEAAREELRKLYGNRLLLVGAA
jgi:hypothetical protein